ncbi:hypothetical protein BCR34DRAFT_576858 [Clohesyomyces aquaticus]|uniref:Copper acquisition factor BIM1-like domain-containing protein n=1 Tax=Clohesyomyces aquaticus TaxID=1231657 RepID=A0A1Y1YLJ7_9PLEO|nr:hypothetical protein BCR34DRAFT_576858 [Clohesyomyces aquaticus]
MLLKPSPPLLSLFYLLSFTSAHFVLFDPVSLGYDDVNEVVGPCDGFNPTDRSTGVTDWPIGGAGFTILSTHPNVTWDINAALLSDPTNFVPLVPVLAQQGVGFFCEPQIPGNPAWVGQDAILQLIQHAPDGLLYQVLQMLHRCVLCNFTDYAPKCAAIRFVAGGPAAPPASCTNDTGVEAQWIKAPPPPSSSTTPPPPPTSSSSPPPPPSSTSSAPPPPTSTPTPPPSTSTDSPPPPSTGSLPPQSTSISASPPPPPSSDTDLPPPTSTLITPEPSPTKTHHHPHYPTYYPHDQNHDHDHEHHNDHGHEHGHEHEGPHC